VTAWTTGGNVPDATVRLVAAPTSLKPTFSFGCGSDDGSASCDLGALDASSAQRQLQAKVTVAASATTVTSVRLTAVAAAANVSKDPQVSEATTVTAAPAATPSSSSSSSSSSSGNSTTDPTTPGIDTSPLSVGDLPGIADVPSASPLLSPGGNAAGLFPSLTPSADPPGKAGTDKASGRAVANTAALPLGAPVIGGQLVGLGVLALAFVLAVARLSLRRRPAAAQAQAGSAAAAPPTPAGPPKPATGPAPTDNASGAQQPAEPDGDDPPKP